MRERGGREEVGWGGRGRRVRVRTFEELLGEGVIPQGSVGRERGSRVHCETSQAGAPVGRADPDGRVGRAGHSNGIFA